MGLVAGMINKLYELSMKSLPNSLEKQNYPAEEGTMLKLDKTLHLFCKSELKMQKKAR